MKNVFKASRAILGIVYTILHIVIVTAPGYLIEGIYCAIVSLGNGAAFRNRFTWHTLGHGVLLFRILCVILGIKARFHLPKVDVSRMIGPFIVIANHQSLIDTLLLCVASWLVKQTRARWVLKRAVWWFFPVALAAYVTKCAFVKRTGKGSGDLEAVIECASQAHQDNANFLFFPEGGRFKGTRQGAKFQFVTDPRPGGWQKALGAMPTADVLVVKIRWGGTRAGLPFGRTLWEGAFAFVNNTLDVTIEYVPRAVVDADPQWLQNRWQTMEEELAVAAYAEAA